MDYSKLDPEEVRLRSEKAVAAMRAVPRSQYKARKPRHQMHKNRKNYVPAHRKRPEGTEDEMTEAYNQALGYSVVLMDYADKSEVIPDEVLAQQRRIFHFAKNGPTKGYFIANNGESKLTSPDVLYILSVKIPARILAKTFNVEEITVRRIRSGESLQWSDEYRLVRRLRKAVMGKYKKNFLKTHVTLLMDASTDTVLQLFSSKKKAVEYREIWLINNRKYPTPEVRHWLDTGKVDKLFPIIEREMMP